MAEYVERQSVLAKKFNLESRLHEPIPIVLASEIERLPAADVRPAISREQMIAALEKYFEIGNSYTYELTRVKEAFEIGTMSLQDFVEWDSDKVEDLCDYLFKLMEGPVSGE